MLLKISFVLLIAWLLGVFGLYRIGDLVHVIKQAMTTQSTSVSFRRFVPR